MKDLAAVHDRLYVIVNDGALFDAAASLPNVRVFKDLESFITTPECQEALQQLQTEIVNENLDRVQGLLSDQKEQLEGMVDADMYEALSLRPFTTEDLTGVEEEASVVAVYGTPKVTLDFWEMEYYGGSEIGIPFESSVECGLTFPIDGYPLHSGTPNRLWFGDQSALADSMIDR
jgi:hypothetical protein